MAATTTERAAAVQQLDDRAIRALTEYLVVLDDVGRARDAPGLYVVYSQDGRHRYLVDAHAGACECDDQFYRDVQCKHVHRVRYETGAKEVPAWVDRSNVDPALLDARDDTTNR